MVPSPTFQLTKPAQPQTSTLAVLRQSAEVQPGQQADLSQGSYPQWMLQSSNPAGCIPDSLGTQSPWHKDKTGHALPEQHPSISPQQLRAANEAALQELMTQVDASEADNGDLDADAANPAADADRQEDMNQSSAQPMDKFANSPVSHTRTTNHKTPLPGGVMLKDCHSREGRGAGTPAGPHEEFYSPQEHLQPDSLDTSDCTTAMPSPSTAAAAAAAAAAAERPAPAAIPDSEAKAARPTAAFRLAQPTVDTATDSAAAASAPLVSGVDTAAVPAAVASTAQGNDPDAAAVPAAAQTDTSKLAPSVMPAKTPAPGKHRLTSTR